MHMRLGRWVVSNLNSAFNLSAASIDACLVIDPDPLSTKSSGNPTCFILAPIAVSNFVGKLDGLR